MGTCERCVSRGKGGCDFDGVREALDRALGIDHFAAGNQRSSLEVRQIGIGPVSCEGMLVLAQAHFEGPRDTQGDLVLHGEDVVDRTIESERPDVAAGRCVDQLGGDSQSVTRAVHAAFDQLSRVEGASDVPRVRRLVAKRER